MKALRWIGLALQIIGVVIAAAGLWLTWREYGRDRSFWGPIVRLFRQGWAWTKERAIRLWMKLGGRRPATVHAVTGSATGTFKPRISDAELVTLAVAQALLGFTSEARWLRFGRAHLQGLFPYLPQQPGYNKRLRKLVGTLSWLIRALGTRTGMFGDDVWIADSTPVECGRSRETAKRSDLAGFAEYGYCASHSRYFWGLRLHLLCTLHGLPIAAAVTGAKADERQVLLGMLDDADLTDQIPGTTLIADKNYYGREFETTLAVAGITLLRPTRKGEKPPPG